MLPKAEADIHVYMTMGDRPSNLGSCSPVAFTMACGRAKDAPGFQTTIPSSAMTHTVGSWFDNNTKQVASLEPRFCCVLRGLQQQTRCRLQKKGSMNIAKTTPGLLSVVRERRRKEDKEGEEKWAEEEKEEKEAEEEEEVHYFTPVFVIASRIRRLVFFEGLLL